MSKMHEWSKGQRVAVVSPWYAPEEETVAKVFTRDGKVVSVKVGSSLYSASGHQKGGGYTGRRIEPWTKEHEAAIERARLLRRVKDEYTKAPTEALRAFVTAIDAAKDA